MNFPGRMIGLVATTAIAALRIVKLDADGGASQAGADETAALFGISDGGADVAIGRVADCVFSDIPLVEYGGDVDINDSLTSDADGKAIAAAPASGVTVACIGFATVAGDSGTHGSVRLAPHFITGA